MKLGSGVAFAMPRYAEKKTLTIATYFSIAEICLFTTGCMEKESTENSEHSKEPDGSRIRQSRELRRGRGEWLSLVLL